jgi:hypothetical protein
MSDDRTSGSRSSGRGTAEASEANRPANTRLPLQEAQQPDPMLQMGAGTVGTGWVTLVALAIAVILGIVFYGLNGTSSQPTAAAPPAPSVHPAAGGASGAPTPTAPRAKGSGTKG